MKLAPVRLSPIFVPRIWGRRNLAPLFDLASGPSGPAQIAEPIGEVWLTGERSCFATGEFQGRALGEVWPALPEAWKGQRCRNLPRIPLLVKFLFPEEKLSVQVHPTDDYAQAHEAAAGGVGKTEMWYAVYAREGSELRLGFEPGVTREIFCQAIAEGNPEEVLRRFAVHAGDAFFVPAGMAHTIGAGAVLCEVQQHSDLTYRIFDYNRLSPDGKPRALHIGQALEVLNFAATCGGGRTESIAMQRGPLCVTYLAACRYFATERWDFSERVDGSTSPECFELLITLTGCGEIEAGAEKQAYGPAEAWLMPAALGAYRLVPQAATSLLRTYVPDLVEFGKTLASEKIDSAAIAGLVHR